MKNLELPPLRKFVKQKGFAGEIAEYFLRYAVAVRRNVLAGRLSLVCWLLASPIIGYVLSTQALSSFFHGATLLALACFSVTFLLVWIEERGLARRRASRPAFGMELTEFEHAWEIFKRCYGKSLLFQPEKVQEKFLETVQAVLLKRTSEYSPRGWSDFSESLLSDLYRLYWVACRFVPMQSFGTLMDIGYANFMKEKRVREIEKTDPTLEKTLQEVQNLAQKYGKLAD